jgi:hypothetical protein
VVCRSADISQEHVFAKWVRDALPLGGSFALTHKYGDGTTWQSGVPDLKANRTCRQCNNRWIARLDEATKPNLTSALRGEATTIASGSPQATVAAWCFKTVLLLELCAKGRASFIKPRDYRAFYELRHPPPVAFVWLTAYRPGADEEEFQRGGFAHETFASTCATVPTARVMRRRSTWVISQRSSLSTIPG